MENGFGGSILQVDNEPSIQTLFAQVRAIRFNLVDRYQLGQPDNVPEKLLAWILQHSCFTINRYLVHSDGLTNSQRRWGVKYNAAICNF
eukprot:2410746-Amphidinium_carterae.1